MRKAFAPDTPTASRLVVRFVAALLIIGLLLALTAAMYLALAVFR